MFAFNLGALVVAALRTAVTDPALVEAVDGNTSAIGQVREGMDGITAQLTAIKDDIAANDAVDDAQAEALEAVIGQLTGLADALTGPAEDDEDNGVISEVEPAVSEDETSTAADQAIADAADQADDESSDDGEESDDTDTDTDEGDDTAGAADATEDPAAA